MEVSSDACLGADLQYNFIYIHISISVWFYFISAFWFVSRPEIYLWKKIYLVNRPETHSRKSLIPFNAIWGLCWYNLRLLLESFDLKHKVNIIENGFKVLLYSFGVASCGCKWLQNV